MTRSTIALSSYLRFADQNVRAVLVLQDIQGVYAQLAADKLQHTRAAEAALAAAHACTGAAFDAVDGVGGHFAVESCQNLALGNGLAAADHAAVGGLLLDQCGLFLCGKFLETDMAAAFAKIAYVLKPMDIVLVRSGAAPFWGTAEYLVKGCGMGREATLWLLKQGVKVVGTDAWSWDRPLPFIAEDFAQHHDASVIWEGHFAGIEKEYCHMEKMANLDQLPSFGFKVACFPIKIKGASAGWTRPVAILP